MTSQEKFGIIYPEEERIFDSSLQIKKKSVLLKGRWVIILFVSGYRTKSNGPKLQLGRLRFDIKKKIIMTMVKYWDR